jgi:cob(I)alamin adenosyltransferase
MKGYIHLYTGEGKGKTTAAIGLAIRAAGAGKKVYIAQFVKGLPYSEITAIQKHPEIELHQFGLDCFINKDPQLKDIEAARKGLVEVSMAIFRDSCDLLILDEVCIALHYNLFKIQELEKLLKCKPEAMEIVLTGRHAPKELFELADLVTEMKQVKHYYELGVQARKGIEF